MKRILLIPHIKVQNANALSSPFTIGIPAMTAWLGAVHALQRKIISAGFKNIVFCNTGVIIHKVDLQTHKGVGDFVYSIIGTGNPLDKNGDRPSFIEEARCHLEASILIEYIGIERDDMANIGAKLEHFLNTEMKIAGGDILSFNTPQFYTVDEDDSADLMRLIRKVMPGYAIIERRELMVDAMKNGKDAIDALLDYLAVQHTCEQDSSGNVTWTSNRKASGWIVPIATGLHGITEPGYAKNQREQDLSVQHRFAESVVTLGEFRMPHNINSLDEIMWRYHVDLEKSLYLCQQSSNNF